MSKKKLRDRKVVEPLNIGERSEPETFEKMPAVDEAMPIDRRIAVYLKAHSLGIGVTVFVLLLVIGVMAKNGWFPSTDPFSGKKTGWFGKELPKNATSTWNPLAPPPPNPTPLPLAKEYIYAGSRMLAVEDSNVLLLPPADIAVWRPSNGVWYVLGGPGSAQTYYGWGMSGDIPVQGDYDGDGKTDFCVFRPATTSGVWWILNSSNGGLQAPSLGQSGDVPVAGDFDGDGKTDITIFRPSTGYWSFIYSSNQSTNSFQFGVSCSGGQGCDIPAIGDYDGDRKADAAVWRDSDHTFYSLNSSNGQWKVTNFGASGDKPVCADYDGDGITDLAVFRPTINTWYIKRSTDGQTETHYYGAATDVLVPNDYDGDGKVDVAVWRPSTGTWFIHNSSTGQDRYEYWGGIVNGIQDIPVPALYRR